MSHKPAILLVDDEPDILYSLVGLLRREFEVHTAESGDEALKIMAEHPIHVLITDQRMPQMTGSELSQKVYQKYPATTRILFTGYADIKSVIEAINSGGLFKYVTKPWDPDELIELLRDAAAEYAKEIAAQRLIEDVSKYVTHGHEIAESLLQDTNGQAVDRGILESFAEESDQLENLLTVMRKREAGV